MGDQATPSGTVRIEIFDPPMCCPTGLCGPSIDPALLDVHEAILKVTAEFSGRVHIERYLLGQQPQKFAQQPEVIARLKAHGVPVLPITLLNGRVVKEREYPTYSALRAWIAQAADPVPVTEAR